MRASSRRLLPGVLPWLLLAACAAPPRGVDSDPVESSVPEAPSARPEPGARPYALSDDRPAPSPSDDVAFEEDYLPPRPEEIRGQSLGRGSVDTEEVGPAEGLELPVQPSNPTPAPATVGVPVAPSPEGRRVRGFRVQLLAASDRGEADAFAREFRARIPVTVHVVFESPFFKVRAGDFLDRADAIALRDRARSNGYASAWVVATEVFGGP